MYINKSVLCCSTKKYNFFLFKSGDKEDFYRVGEAKNLLCLYNEKKEILLFGQKIRLRRGIFEDFF